MSDAGGIRQIKIADEEALTTPTTITKDKLLKEGQQLGDPDFFTDTLHDEQQVQTGIRIPVELRMRSIPILDGDTLISKAESGTPQFVEFEMMSGRRVLFKNVLLKVAHKGVAEFGKFGFLRLSFEATGLKAADVYTITEPG